MRYEKSQVITNNSQPIPDLKDEIINGTGGIEVQLWIFFEFQKVVICQTLFSAYMPHFDYQQTIFEMKFCILLKNCGI